MNANEQQNFSLTAGQVLTIVAASGASGSAIRLSRVPGGGDAQSVTAIASGATYTFGPYADMERFKVVCTAGTITVSVTTYDPSLNATDAEVAALLSPLCLNEKTPVNAVAASGTLTVTSGGDKITDGDTVTIGTKTYTFKTTLTPTEGEVLIGANDTAALLNLKNAINHAGTPDTDYKCAAAHPTVIGVSSSATTCVIAAKTKGEAGNSIATTTTGAELSWGNTHLEGGVDGTTGSAYEICADDSYLYYCIADNDVTGNNWRRISLGSAY